MESVNLFALASRQAEWLSARQSALAGNIANVNTPGYRATDVEPFAKVLDRGGVSMVATSPLHFGTRAQEVSFKTREVGDGGPDMPSKNSVVLENELMKAGEVGRAYELNTAIVKAFHRLTLMSVKG